MVGANDELLGDPLSLEVDGRSFTGWEMAELSRSLDALSGAFQLGVNGRAGFPYPIRPGQRVTLRLGEAELLNGYVDRFRGSFDKRSGRKLRVGGRDVTADLVDASSDLPEVLEVTLAELAETICAPFGIDVAAAPRFSSERFSIVQSSPAESAWSTLERLARSSGALAFTSGAGNLILAEPGAGGRADVALVEGDNVMKVELAVDYGQRFGLYVVRGQAPGTDLASGFVVSAVEGSAEDAELGRHRPLVILSDYAVSADQAQQHAAWEAIRRAARSSTLTIEVQGWRQQPSASARPWTVNELVPVRIPSYAIDDEFLLAGVTFTRDRTAGTTSTLELVRPDAFVPNPAVEPDADPFRSFLDGVTPQ